MEPTTASPTQPAPAAAPQQQQKQHGTSFQPYQQPAQPFQQPAPYYAYGASPRVIPFDKNWYWAKLALTVASILFSVILLGLGLGISLRPSDSYYTYAGSLAWIVVPLVVLCLIWDIAEVITLFTCGRRRKSDVPQQAQQQDAQQQQKQQTAHHGIHPGAHVGVDLMLWLAGIVVLLFSIAGSFDSSDYYCDSSYYTSSSYYREYCSDEYQNSMKNFYRPAHRALLAFISLLIITHFVIFVRACIEVNQRNRMRGPVIMVPSSHMSMYIVPGQQQPGMMPAMPPQTHMTPANEKAAGAAHPQSNTAPAEGFYAPAPSSSTGHAGQAV